MKLYTDINFEILKNIYMKILYCNFSYNSHFVPIMIIFLQKISKTSGSESWDQKEAACHMSSGLAIYMRPLQWVIYMGAQSKILKCCII